MHHILVVEDAEDARELIRCVLCDAYELSLAETLEAARRRLAGRVPDLILLDLRLPDGSGFEFCAELQARAATRDVPIVFLTSCSETQDKVLAFSLGADDYVEKPFDPQELLARIASRLRKSESVERRTVAAGPLRVDSARFRATIDTDEGTRELDLTPHELKLLFELVARRGEVATRAELLEAAWGRTTVSDRTLNTHLSNLRRKLGRNAPSIESVRGVGYRLRVAG